MKTNDAGLELIKSFEGCKLTAYLDSANVWTIGWGHTPSHKGEVITQEQADSLLASDLARFEAAVTRLVTVPLTDNQFAALVSFSYNLGEGALSGSTLLRKLNAGDYEGAIAEFVKWDNVRGKPSTGILRRRKAEAALFQDGMPAKNQNPINSSKTIKASAVGGVGAAGVILDSTYQLQTAQEHLNSGNLVGIILGFCILAAIGWTVYARIKDGSPR